MNQSSFRSYCCMCLCGCMCVRARVCEMGVSDAHATVFLCTASGVGPLLLFRWTPGIELRAPGLHSNRLSSPAEPSVSPATRDCFPQEWGDMSLTGTQMQIVRPRADHFWSGTSRAVTQSLCSSSFPRVLNSGHRPVLKLLPPAEPSLQHPILILF